MDINVLLQSQDVSSIINTLRQKEINLTDWAILLKSYEPTMHEIVHDNVTRRDKERDGGGIDKASRIHIGPEKLLVSRMVDFMFALPVKRIYTNIDGNETRQKIADAIENIYRYARINTENIKRGVNYFASCEFFTMWYVVEAPNTQYGFNSKYKIRCKTYSPMNGTRLYPLFDEQDDLVAMSFRYEKTIENKTITYFETYTADKRYKWKSDDGSWKEVTNESIIIGKIPGVYGYRPKPIYDGLSHLRHEIEYTLSRNSDIIAYNSAPVLKVSGGIQGAENKGETQRIVRTENGGDVAYVSWAQSIEATKYQVEKLLSLFFMQSQMPDISFEKMATLGNIGYDARQTMFMDAHLRVGEESGAWIEYFEREANVIKAFLKQANTEWASEIDNVEIEHVISPFIQNSEDADITKYMKACGGKPVMSQLEAIKYLGMTDNAADTLKQIQTEAEQDAATKMSSLFGAGE